jgi:hypothetical protein
MCSDDEAQPVHVVEVFADVLQQQAAATTAKQLSVSLSSHQGRGSCLYMISTFAFAFTNQTAFNISGSLQYLAVGVPSAARADAPAHAVIRVAPQQVTHGSLVRHLLKAMQLVDLV